MNDTAAEPYYPDGWVRMVVMISPDGREVHAIGGLPDFSKPQPDWPKNWEKLQANLAAIRQVGDLDNPYQPLRGEGPHPVGWKRQ